MSSIEYHRRQAELAARLALAESDPGKAAALQLLVMELYAKAEAAKADAPQLPATDGADRTE